MAREEKFYLAHAGSGLTGVREDDRAATMLGSVGCDRRRSARRSAAHPRVSVRLQPANQREAHRRSWSPSGVAAAPLRTAPLPPPPLSLAPPLALRRSHCAALALARAVWK
ncbi:hypothetical protein GUJ93_ZPchr0004g39050 [Zizania palustris]|uniref:Uncharacterized protein n=1 Tax=Zizania palustris TaxID=103762 RepID=A0A8J5S1X2_ZIZPA|nr:hypothetical protein GUJ93_ZPchr0004g39050 [Zizania palustris]